MEVVYYLTKTFGAVIKCLDYEYCPACHKPSECEWIVPGTVSSEED